MLASADCGFTGRHTQRMTGSKRPEEAEKSRACLAGLFTEQKFSYRHTTVSHDGSAEEREFTRARLGRGNLLRHRSCGKHATAASRVPARLPPGACAHDQGQKLMFTTYCVNIYLYPLFQSHVYDLAPSTQLHASQLLP